MDNNCFVAGLEKVRVRKIDYKYHCMTTSNLTRLQFSNLLCRLGPFKARQPVVALLYTDNEIGNGDVLNSDAKHWKLSR